MSDYNFDMLAEGIRQIRANKVTLIEAVAKQEEKESQYLQFLREAAERFIKDGGELAHVVKIFADLGIPFSEVTKDGGSD